MVTDEEVLAFFREKSSLMTTWAMKPIPIEFDTVLQEYSPMDELPYTIDEFGTKFNVDLTNVSWSKYFPSETLSLFERWFHADKFEVLQTRKPLTVRMFAESAKAGRWLYD